ncbi:glycosyltransferase family A protein [Micrococcus endophyticus]|uniref:glycosyltransferase family A protein n=1 Tax=Micrococcus endophyticus TaxID=455343 RepID=UPI0034CDDF47
MRAEIPGMVSVVMGCYNAEPAHLAEAIGSVLAQSYESIEVIVVDDGSTREDTRQALSSVPDGVTVIRQANAGVAAARNTAVDAARGEYIQILDSDDRLGPDVVAQGVSVLADPDVVIAYSAADIFGAQEGSVEPASELGLAGLMDTNWLTIASMVRRERWLAVGGQWAPLRDGFEDYEFWVRILRDGGRARRTPSARFEYRVRPVSRSTEISSEGLRRTRDVIVDANPDHHEALLRASWERMDQMTAQLAELKGYVGRWQHRTRHLVAIRGLARRLGRG